MYDIEYRIPYTNAGKRGLLTYFYDGCWTPENQLGAVYPRPSEESESWNSEPSTSGWWMLPISLEEPELRLYHHRKEIPEETGPQLTRIKLQRLQPADLLTA